MSGVEWGAAGWLQYSVSKTTLSWLRSIHTRYCLQWLTTPRRNWGNSWDLACCGPELEEYFCFPAFCLMMPVWSGSYCVVSSRTVGFHQWNVHYIKIHNGQMASTTTTLQGYGISNAKFLDGVGMWSSHSREAGEPHMMRRSDHLPLSTCQRRAVATSGESHLWAMLRTPLPHTTCKKWWYRPLRGIKHVSTALPKMIQSL